MYFYNSQIMTKSIEHEIKVKETGSSSYAESVCRCLVLLTLGI